MNEKYDNETEKRIFGERNIEKLGVHRYAHAGHVVTFRGRSDDGFAKLWGCTCSNGEKMCSHIQAVADAVDSYADEMGYA